MVEGEYFTSRVTGRSYVMNFGWIVIVIMLSIYYLVLDVLSSMQGLQ